MQTNLLFLGGGCSGFQIRRISGGSQALAVVVLLLLAPDLSLWRDLRLKSVILRLGQAQRGRASRRIWSSQAPTICFSSRVMGSRVVSDRLQLGVDLRQANAWLGSEGLGFKQAGDLGQAPRAGLFPLPFRPFDLLDPAFQLVGRALVTAQGGLDQRERADLKLQVTDKFLRIAQ
jgi:hypothetical protein